jgi:hypothetical protein
LRAKKKKVGKRKRKKNATDLLRVRGFGIYSATRCARVPFASSSTHGYFYFCFFLVLYGMSIGLLKLVGSVGGKLKKKKKREPRFFIFEFTFFFINVYSGDIDPPDHVRMRTYALGGVCHRLVGLVALDDRAPARLRRGSRVLFRVYDVSVGALFSFFFVFWFLFFFCFLLFSRARTGENELRFALSLFGWLAAGFAIAR